MSGHFHSLPKKHLFIDDAWIAETFAVHRRPGEVARHPANPVVAPDRPWERGGIAAYGSALEDGGIFRLWYQVYGRGRGDEGGFHNAVGYAESPDGIRWTKPAVGCQATNLVWLGEERSGLFGPCVVRDEADPDPTRRYKMMFFDAMAEKDLAALGSPFPANPPVPGWIPVEGEGLFVAGSPDGLSWRLLERRPVNGDPADALSMTLGGDGVFRACFKTSRRTDRHFRIIGSAESRDFLAWSPTRVILEPDWRDPPGTEFYGMSGFDYFGNRLGLLWVYRNVPDDKRTEIQLASAPDGVNWHRAAERRALFTTGETGAWDAGAVYPASEPLVLADEIRIYYGGFNVRHDDARFQESAIGLASLRLDGFACLEAGYFAGEAVTPPLEPGPGALHLNLDARHGGLAVDVLDAGDGTLVARSRAIEGEDAIRFMPLWDEGGPPSGARPVRLRFRMRKARLYAFWFEQ